MLRRILVFSIWLSVFYASLAFVRHSFSADEDSVTITTYYPSPFGTYNELTSFSNTYLATTDSANVGIGTSSPEKKLEVAGDIQLSNSGQIFNLRAENISGLTAGAACTPNGRIAFKTGENKLYFCAGSQWKAAGGEVDVVGPITSPFPITIPSDVYQVFCALAPAPVPESDYACKTNPTNCASSTISLLYNGATKITNSSPMREFSGYYSFINNFRGVAEWEVAGAGGVLTTVYTPARGAPVTNADFGHECYYTKLK